MVVYDGDSGNGVYDTLSVAEASIGRVSHRRLKNPIFFFSFFCFVLFCCCICFSRFCTVGTSFHVNRSHRHALNRDKRNFFFQPEDTEKKEVELRKRRRGRRKNVKEGR